LLLLIQVVLLRGPPSEILRQVRRGPHIRAHPEQGFQLVLQAAEIEKRRAGQRIDQKVEVPALPVVATSCLVRPAWIRDKKST